MPGHFSSQQGGHGEEAEKPPKAPSTGERQALLVEWNGSEWLPTLNPFTAGGYAGPAHLREGLLIPYGNLTIGSNLSNLLAAAEANTGMGLGALNSLTSGTYNTAVGQEALYSDKTGDANTALGAFALYSSEGFENVAIGNEALFKNKVGSANIGIGYEAMLNSEAGENLAIGMEVLRENKVGSGNTVVGTKAGFGSLGSNNVFVGHLAGSEVTGGTNICIGYQEGMKAAGGELYIGYAGTSYIRGSNNGKFLGFYGVTPVAQANEIKAVGVGKLELAFVESLALGYEEIRTLLHNIGITK